VTEDVKAAEVGVVVAVVETTLKTPEKVKNRGLDPQN
jgi:hypothetical protein